MTKRQIFIKRLFDFSLAFIAIILCLPIILFAWILASIDTKSNGFFLQLRVGMHGKGFKLIKIKTMIPIEGIKTNITKVNDQRITQLGSILRRGKIDELPQLFNVLIGQMSFVGPRPDVPGYADKLKEKQKIFLSIRPGITGPASIKYRNEEQILMNQENAQKYNDEVIWPDKVKINIDYINNWTFFKDIKYIFLTFKSLWQ